MTASSSQHCPECGGEQLAWRVHRTATRQLRHSQREIRWSCRGCAHEWVEGVDLRPDDPLFSIPA